MPIELTQLPGSRPRRRRGRGISAGQGKTAGRGMKGQHSRGAGKVPPRFEGGRMPVIRQFPKYDGFFHRRKREFHPINLRDLGEVEAGASVDLAWLGARGLLPRRRLPIKILGSGEIEVEAHFTAHAFSASARGKIEAAGGSCEVLPL